MPKELTPPQQRRDIRKKDEAATEKQQRRSYKRLMEDKQDLALKKWAKPME